MAKHRRSKLRVYVHFVWATRDRLPLLTPDIERRVHRYLEAVCNEAKCEVFAVDGLPDHVHVFIALSANVTLSELARNMKEGSSRLISEELKPGEWFAWQHGYAAFSTRKKDIPLVTAYIHNQKRRHEENRLWPEVEETYEELEDEDEEVTT